MLQIATNFKYLDNISFLLLVNILKPIINTPLSIKPILHMYDDRPHGLRRHPGKPRPQLETADMQLETADQQLETADQHLVTTQRTSPAK
jgi:hypothetical protein